jgi:TRAP-type C4-dicarboxylate transport system permease small subunit
MRKIEQLLNVVERASAAVAASIIFALMILVVSDVLGRKLFNSPVYGAIEIAALTLPVVVFLTISYLQSSKEHISIDLFTAGLSQRTQIALDAFGLAVAIGVMLLVILKLTASAWESTVGGEYAMGIVQVPIWPARIFVAYGTWLFGVRLLVDFVSACSALNAPKAHDC